MQLEFPHRGAATRAEGVRLCKQSCACVRTGSPSRQAALAISRNHRQQALCKIAEIVREIGVDSLDDRLVRIIAVLTERRLAQEEIAELIDAVMFGKREGVDHVADGLDIFSPRLNRNPWTAIWRGGGISADIRKAGQ